MCGSDPDTPTHTPNTHQARNKLCERKSRVRKWAQFIRAAFLALLHRPPQLKKTLAPPGGLRVTARAHWVCTAGPSQTRVESVSGLKVKLESLFVWNAAVWLTHTFITSRRCQKRDKTPCQKTSTLQSYWREKWNSGFNYSRRAWTGSGLITQSHFY